jgi:hypothetical protein
MSMALKNVNASNVKYAIWCTAISMAMYEMYVYLPSILTLGSASSTASLGAIACKSGYWTKAVKVMAPAATPGELLKASRTRPVKNARNMLPIRLAFRGT